LPGFPRFPTAPPIFAAFIVPLNRVKYRPLHDPYRIPRIARALTTTAIRGRSLPEREAINLSKITLVPADEDRVLRQELSAPDPFHLFSTRFT